MRECCICICVYCYRLPSRSHGTTSNTISSIIINDYQRQDGLGVLYTPIKFIPRQWRPRWDSTVPSFGIACEKKMQSSGDHCESVDVLL